MSIGKVTHLSVIGKTTLNLGWDDGFSAPVDLASVLAGRKPLAALAKIDVFARAALSDDGWSVEWPNGIDFGAQQLRRWANEQAGEAMPAAAFRAWMDRHAFTLDRAADALGLSRRTIAYYLSGEQPIPKTVMLATEGVDQRLAA
jgi:Protein of unknown function (DUF2442)